MKLRLLLAFIFLGSLYISFSVGQQFEKRQSNEVTVNSMAKVCSLSTAYAAALFLESEMSNHKFIKSGNAFVAEQFSLDRLDITIKQITGIDYKDTAFEAEINQHLVAARNYVNAARNQAK